MRFPPIASTGSSERRQLTLLFCDLVDYSGIARLLDPEDLHALVDAYRHCCEEHCIAQGGTTPAYGGDGILFVFGHPEAHEDDAQRAVRAGLAVVDAVPRLSGTWTTSLPFPLSVRVGIATGLCVVDAASVVGESVNLAARLQAAAAENTVVAADATHRLLGGLFECHGLGALALKGFPHPVAAWRVSGARDVATRFESAHGGGHTRLVGRQRELRRLLEAWASAESGRGGVVRVRGEAGIGKSRLIHELRRRADPESAATLTYQCLPHHQHSALFPVIAQLERALDIDHGVASIGLDQIETLLVGSAEEIAAEVPVLAALLSVPVGERSAAPPASPLERKRRTFDVLCAQVARRAARRSLLIIVEDAQWLDPTSTEYLALLTARISELKVLIVIAERPRQGADAQAAETVDLAALSHEEGKEMVALVAGGRDVPSILLERILARTDGVPLYIEELTEAILANDAGPGSGVSNTLAHAPIDAAIPTTLQNLLVARLDQQGPAKSVAQLASVIGREFSSDLLSSIVGVPLEKLEPALSRLTAAGLLLPRRGGFFFKHALIQDAAYQSLLRSRRRELHGRLATVLEGDTARHAAGQFELLAHHYALSGFDLKALEFWLRAGQSALERSANVEACEHFEHALDARRRLASENLDHLELDCQIGLGAARRAVQGFASPGVEDSFARARDLAERGVGGVAQLMDALRGLFACYYTRSDFRRAREQSERVMEHAGSNPAYVMMGNWMLGSILFWQGEFAGARHHLESALRLYDPERQRSRTLDTQIDLQANAMLHLGWTLWFLGYADQARAMTDEAISLSRQLGQPFALAMALFWACAVRVCCGDRARVESLTAELRAVTTKYHIAYLATACTALEAHSAVAEGNVAAGVGRVRRALEEFRRQRAGLGWTFAISLPAVACARLGQIDDGLALIAEGFDAAERHGDYFWEAELYRIKGDLLRARSGAREDADACYRRAAALAERQGARFLVLRAVTSLAELHGSKSPEETVIRLQSLCGTFVEGHDTNDLQNARRQLALCTPDVASSA